MAAVALRANARWLSVDDEITLLARLVPLAPVFEEQLLPVGKHARTIDARLLPGQLAIYSTLSGRGRWMMAGRFDDPAMLDAFFAVKDGVCPTVLDDRDLHRKIWSLPSAARCLPAPLPSDELGDVERLAAELPGPWPRAVRAIAALREYRKRSTFNPTLAQQKHFVEGCMLHPMCPLWLLDKPDKGLAPVLLEARGRATPEQAAEIDTALRKVAGGQAANAPDLAKLEAEAPACVAKIAEALASTTGEPWMREARAHVLRDTCFALADMFGTPVLRAMLPSADPVTAGTFLGALATRAGKPLPVADVARVAADIRARDGLFAKLEEGKRQREMPPAWAKEDPLVDAEAYAWIARWYGTVPDTFEYETTLATFVQTPVRIVYVRVSAKGEYAAVPPVTVAVGPLGGALHARHILTGTDWGTRKEGIRAFVEAKMDGSTTGLFTDFE